jgi:sodium/hydrogen antiporter
MTLVAIFVILLFAYSLLSGRLARTPVTPAIAFTAAGVLTYVGIPALGLGAARLEVFLNIAEVGLVLLLFTDASRTDLAVLRDIRALPMRLLSVGMLLTILLGAIAALVVFRQLSVWQAGILAAILAPTDAGLGQVIVSSPRVPVRIRQALNVEAGLNDGLSVPFLLFFIALAGASEGGQGASLSRLVVEQLGYGALVGIGVGLAGGALLGLAHHRGWMADELRQLGVVALPVLCILASDAVGASMFIAAFVAGLAVQVGFIPAGGHCVEFTETWGQVLNNSVFFLFGVLVARAWPDLRPIHALYAVLSLTVVRMVPVAIALLGSGLSRASVVFMGWFGPRGLASIVLGLVYLEHASGNAEPPAIRLAVMATVLLSIVAHGLSAGPGIDRLSRSAPAVSAGAGP